ncbi:MAG: hypothetical protein KF734_17915 [Saprospiraceae bacterium]|nr:hypothetical protein [Saprospiraceae bacterium]MCW5924561.1 hypothetical protein [Saprospiraceae bacterium]
MSTDERIRKRPKLRTPLIIMGAAMSFFFVCFGAYILIDKNFMADIPNEFRNIFAVVVLIYGVFRGWRVYSEYF